VSGQAVARPAPIESERRRKLFGTEVRVLAGPPARAGAPPAAFAAALAEIVLLRRQNVLTRFDEASELSRLNAAPGGEHELSPLLAEAIDAALLAADRSGGLVDPTLLGALRRAGYARSRAGAEPADLRAALAVAPRRRPATPDPAAAWRTIELTGTTVHRPAGVRLDLGGSAKGLAADHAAATLAGQASFVVDAGGDLVLGGRSPSPRRVTIADPFDAARELLSFELAAGAIATSGLATRIWTTPEGFAHHLLDPSDGRPAWTGVVQATALADSALAAETLAKVALLRGPDGGRATLAEHGGGALVLDDGELVVVDPTGVLGGAVAA
jgi:thiamine biosynthesis lipoprotein